MSQTPKNGLGTPVCPRDFDFAASKHGRFFARYVLAAQYASGKRVLDAACGSGFGSAWLARSAQSVLGLDLDDEMLQEATHWSHLPNLKIQKHDLNQPLPGRLQFDLVTSFETLEHVNDPSACLANLVAGLQDAGMAIISIPNGTKELRDGHPIPGHLSHFAAEDFTKMAFAHFREVEFFSQQLHRGIGHYLRKFTGEGKHHARDYRFVPGLNDQAKTWLAICRLPVR